MLRIERYSSLGKNPGEIERGKRVIISLFGYKMLICFYETTRTLCGDIDYSFYGFRVEVINLNESQ